MKSLVEYYSSSGNTRKVAKTLCGYLARYGTVQEVDLVPIDPPRSFFGQCQAAFWQRKARLADMSFECSGYELVCVGTPVWAFGPAPAVNAFLAKATGIAGKKIVLFNTHGGGPGIDRCLGIMRKALAAKAADVILSVAIYQERSPDQEFVLQQFAPVAQWIGH